MNEKQQSIHPAILNETYSCWLSWNQTRKFDRTLKGSSSLRWTEHWSYQLTTHTHIKGTDICRGRKEKRCTILCYHVVVKKEKFRVDGQQQRRLISCVRENWSCREENQTDQEQEHVSNFQKLLDSKKSVKCIITKYSKDFWDQPYSSVQLSVQL